jgi:hypothetical protein
VTQIPIYHSKHFLKITFCFFQRVFTSVLIINSLFSDNFNGYSPTLSPATITATASTTIADSRRRRRRNTVYYITGMNSFGGLKAHNSVASLGLPACTGQSFAKVVGSLKLPSQADSCWSCSGVRSSSSRSVCWRFRVRNLGVLCSFCSSSSSSSLYLSWILQLMYWISKRRMTNNFFSFWQSVIILYRKKKVRNTSLL